MVATESLYSANMKATVSAFINQNCDLGLVSDASINFLWAEVYVVGEPRASTPSDEKGALLV